MADLTALLEAALRDRYALERELGRGGMATVYLARDLRHRRPVALKVLHPELSYALSADRFQREIEVAAALSHPHILPLFDSGEVEGLLYYVMPHIEGETLRQRLQRETQLPVEDAVRIAREVAEALAAAHAQGVVHRDIKPENILLSHGHALVADFGIARAMGQAESERLTETGVTVGTAAYMSPEQAQGDRQVDGRSDLYSLGCVLHEMLTGEPPYTGPTAQVVIAKRLSDPVASVRRVRPEVPPHLDQLLARALARVPADRFANAEALARALAPAGSASVGVSAAGPNPARRRRLLWGLALVAALGIGALLLPRLKSEDGAITARADGPPLVAVLPFRTIGSDTSQRYFSAGMTEEIAGQLSRVGALRVVSSTVSQAYEDKDDRLRRMREELGVGSVVSGTVRLAGQEVRIAVQLADTRSGEALWSEQYDGSMADVFAVQSDVAHRVADALQAELTPTEAERLERPRTVNPAAYDLYLRSLSFSPMHEGDLAASVVLLRQAIAIDSGFAAAHAELGRRFLFLSVYGNPAYRDSASRATRHALAIHPNDPNALAYLASLHTYEGQLSRARQFFTRALALNPSSVPALGDLSYTEIVLGRLDEGLRWAVRALPLTGHDANSYYHVGAALLRLDLDEVTEAWLEAGRRRPPPGFARIEILLATLDLVRHEDRLALERIETASERQPDNEEVRAFRADLSIVLNLPAAEALTARLARENPHARSGWLLPESFGALHGLALFRRGQRSRAEALWSSALAADRRDMEAGHESPERPMQTAAIHAIRGETTPALEWLERGYRAGWNDARLLARDPFFLDLHDERRFQDLLGRMEADVARMRESVRPTTDSLMQTLSRR